MKETRYLLDKKINKIVELKKQIELLPTTIDTLQRLLDEAKEKAEKLPKELEATEKEYVNLLRDEIEESGHFLFSFNSKIPNHIKCSEFYECSDNNKIIESYYMKEDKVGGLVSKMVYEELDINRVEEILNNIVSSRIRSFEDACCHGEDHDIFATEHEYIKGDKEVLNNEVRENADMENALSLYTNEYLVFVADVRTYQKPYVYDAKYGLYLVNINGLNIAEDKVKYFDTIEELESFKITDLVKEKEIEKDDIDMDR